MVIMTPELKRFVDALRDEFPEYFASGEIWHLGVTNCRTKNNKPGAPYSEHSWSNAVDIMLRTKDGVPGDRIAAWARSSSLASEVFWKVAAHHDHVHVTANPRRNYDNKQIPPCAGGEDDMPLSDSDVERVADAVIARVPEAVWFHLVTNPISGVRRGAQSLLADAVSYSHTAAFRPFSAVGASAKSIVDAIKAQWAK